MNTATIGEPVTNWPGFSGSEPSSAIPLTRRHYNDQDDIAKADHAKADAAAAKRRDFTTRLNQLQLNVDRATEQLALAESREAFFKFRITQLRETVKTLWGSDQTVVNVDPAISLLDAYQSIDTLISATADFPRMREQLVKNLNASKLILSQFQRDNQP